MPLLLIPILWGVGLTGAASTGTYILGRVHGSEEEDTPTKSSFNYVLWGLAAVGAVIIYKKVKS